MRNSRIGMLTDPDFVRAADLSQFAIRAFCMSIGPDPVACGRQYEQNHHLPVCHSLSHAGWQLYTSCEVFRILQI